MAYARILETGTYIWPDGEHVIFNEVSIPDKDINIFLARLYDSKKDEFRKRLSEGRKLVRQNKVED